MNNNISYRIISVFENATERDYLNEFLKFVGFFTYYDTLENNSNKNWIKSLFSDENKTGIDLVINYYGNDFSVHANPETDNNFKNKIYLYFDFDSLICGVSYKPLKNKEEALNKFKVENKSIMRRKILEDLINSLFQQDISEQLLTVLDAYAPKDGSYNLYIATQIAYGLSIIECDETKKDKAAQIKRINYSKYLENILINLFNSYIMLEKENNSQNIYSLYSQIRIEQIRNMIIHFISPLYINESCELIPKTILYRKLNKIHELDPSWISSVLCLASISHREFAEDCYLYAIKDIPDIDKNKIAYASILYNYGKLIEEQSPDKAIMLYQSAYKNNPSDYCALFSKIYLETSTKKIGFERAKTELATAISQITTNHNNKMAEIDNDGKCTSWDNLSLIDKFYIWRILLLMAKIEISSYRERSAKLPIHQATTTASYFESYSLASKAYDENEEEINYYLNYHQSSEYTWILWKILEPWSNNLRDLYIKGVVKNHLQKFGTEENEDNIQKKKKI